MSDTDSLPAAQSGEVAVLWLELCDLGYFCGGLKACQWQPCAPVKPDLLLLLWISDGSTGSGLDL